jgi:hypothetical protein
VHRDEVYAGAEGSGSTSTSTSATSSPRCRRRRCGGVTPRFEACRDRRRRHGALARLLPQARPRVSRGRRERGPRRGAASGRTALHARHRVGDEDRSTRSGSARAAATPSAARSSATRRRRSTASMESCSERAAHRTRNRGTRSGASAMRSSRTRRHRDRPVRAAAGQQQS